MTINTNIIKESWDKLKPAQKKLVAFSVVISLVIIFGLSVHYSKQNSIRKDAASKPPVEKTKEIAIDTHLFEKGLYSEAQKKMTETEKKVDTYREQVEELKKTFAAMGGAPGAAPLPGAPTGKDALRIGTKAPAKAASATVASRGPDGKTIPPIPEAPPWSDRSHSPGSPAVPVSAAQSAGKKSADEDHLVGGIAVVSNTKPSTSAKEKDAEKKSKKSSIYLPPSFMAATMISGLDAPTAEGGKSNPVPAILRVNEPSFLPNEMRANLKGCFVIADGYGSLADERAHLRIKSLSCLSKRGKAVIDQELKGFVVDSDGKIGLRGTVVSKMGAVVARSMLAGLFGGIGDAIRQQSSTTSVSALGTTQTIDAGKAAQAGVGEGLSSAFRELQRFYLDLARQSLPVIEVGAVREVTIVISEGAEVAIKEINNPSGKIK